MTGLPPPEIAVLPAPAPGPDSRGMISVSEVSKFFGSVVAVSDVSFSITAGVTALLGPNGAGKSTLFRMMCGLTPPSRGAVQVLGADPRTDRAVRGRLSLVPQQDALFDHLDALQMVTVSAQGHGVNDPTAAAVTALAHVELGDVGSKRNMIALFHRLGDEGRCVLVSSHVLDEVARLGSRLLVIAQGRLIASGDYHDLRGLMDDRPLRIRIGTSDPRRLASALVDQDLITALSLDATHVVVDTNDADAIGRRLAPLARDLNIRLTEVHPLDDDLESVFRYLVEGR